MPIGAFSPNAVAGKYLIKSTHHKLSKKGATSYVLKDR